MCNFWLPLPQHSPCNFDPSPGFASPFCFCRPGFLTTFWASGLPTVFSPSWFQVCAHSLPQILLFLPLLWVEPAFQVGLMQDWKTLSTFQALSLTLTTDTKSLATSTPLHQCSEPYQIPVLHQEPYTTRCPLTAALFYSQLSGGTRHWLHQGLGQQFAPQITSFQSCSWC